MCLSEQASDCESLHMYVCVYVCVCVSHRFQGGWMEGGVLERFICMRRNGNREKDESDVQRRKRAT